MKTRLFTDHAATQEDLAVDITATTAQESGKGESLAITDTLLHTTAGSCSISPIGQCMVFTVLRLHGTLALGLQVSVRFCGLHDGNGDQARLDGHFVACTW